MQAFLREDLTRFCRDAPVEFTHPQREVFCVFSGEGVSRLREYLKRLAEDQEREERISRDGLGAYSEAEADSSRETISDDDETIDAPEEVAERRPALRPRSTAYRSYADVVSGSGSNSPEREEVADGNDERVALAPGRSGRMSTFFRRRSSRPESSVDHSPGPSFGHMNGYDRRQGCRSVSEGQGSSSRPRFTHSQARAIDDYFPTIAERPLPRALPPRPHQWPPQAHRAQICESEDSPSEEFTTAESSRQATRAAGGGSITRRSNIHRREDSIGSAVYDSDDDGVMSAQPTSGVHRDMDGEMED